MQFHEFIIISALDTGNNFFTFSLLSPILTIQSQFFPVVLLYSYVFFTSQFWLVSTGFHLTQSSSQFPAGAFPMWAEHKNDFIFPRGSRKPGLGTDMTVPFPVPELSHLLGSLWLMSCGREGEISSVFWKSFHWSKW